MNKPRRAKKGKFTTIEPKGPLWARIIDALWLALFWATIIIVAEKGKWVAAKEWGSGVLWITLVSSLAIIVFEVLKYIGAKRLYRLFPWLDKLVNNGRR